MIGVGFGLMFLIAFTGSTRIGIGMGGFLISIGVAFLINGLFESSERHLPVPPAGFSHSSTGVRAPFCFRRDTPRHSIPIQLADADKYE